MAFNQEELNAVATSLKNFFLKEKENSVRPGSQESSSLIKYRGLSLSVNADNPQKPVFIVTIGAFEAHFRISDGLKVHGALGGDERVVQKWYMFGENKRNIEKIALTGGDKKSEPIKYKATITLDEEKFVKRAAGVRPKGSSETQ